MAARKNYLLKRILNDRKFIEYALQWEGLGLSYVRYKQMGPAVHPDEKKILLENIARLVITSDEAHVSYIANLFDYDDLIKIEERIFGKGKIGGKSTGMLLAFNALHRHREHLGFEVRIPDSWYLGSNMDTEFLTLNGLQRFENAKWQESIQLDNYNEFMELLPETRLPQKILKKLRSLLRETHGTPLILRSSSLLEDSHGTPFPGMYESYFIPNCYSLTENLRMTVDAVKNIYSSIFKPDCFNYRKKKGLLQEYEAMAILIQKVVGGRYTSPEGKEYFSPLFSGVGFSQNCYPWSKEVRQGDGVVRLALGLGTAVVSLPEEAEEAGVFVCDLSTFRTPAPEEQLKSSQRLVHAVDLQETDIKKTIKHLPIKDVVAYNGLSSLGEGQNGVEAIISIQEDSGSLARASGYNLQKGFPFITFHSIEKKWGPRLREVVKIIEFAYAKNEMHTFLDESKWTLVGTIIGDCPGDIRERLKADDLSDPFGSMIEAAQLSSEMKENLHYVVEAKRLLENLSDYPSFKSALGSLSNKDLKERLGQIIRRHAIDIEFSVVGDILYILQCRPLSLYEETGLDESMHAIPPERRFIDVKAVCPTAQLDITRVIYVDDEKYIHMSQQQKYAVRDKLSELNNSMGESIDQKGTSHEGDFMFLLPGRVGSSHPELGIPVKYKDINNARILVEYPLGLQKPEFSYGSHFYLRLVGDGIYTFGIQEGDLFRRELIEMNAVQRFFDGAIIVSRLPLGVYMSGVERRVVCEMMEGGEYGPEVLLEM
ncbi:MAG: PEP/pyruvate-binding domain-containing protein [Candidatus Undinarchaeales archaeon]|jgi:hypothetical protein|nr:PEP/pyruvate-binding domain-containing protein [Candidatus Undinarchaeales archaeon]MDP7492175.1 PEP/pyruvate-binding domain-containing protein [Candidatus Undinarchaeales archaeon]